MNSRSDIAPPTLQYSLHTLAINSIVFFLIIIVLTALIFVPQVNEILESQYADEVQIDIALEAELFTKYVEGQRTKLQDLAQFPSIVNAAMLSDSSSPVLLDLIDNIVIGGERGRLVLQDIAGTVLIQSVSDLQGSYGEVENWIDQLVEDEVPYHFQLLGQAGDEFTFRISVPVKYNSLAEGVLSAEITDRLDQVFLAQNLNKHIAFKLVQGQTTVATDSDHIEIVNEKYLELSLPKLTFVYITDEALVRQNEALLRNTILSILLLGLAISFLLFAFYGYRIHAEKNNVSDAKYRFGRAYVIPIVVLLIGVAASVIAFLIVRSIQQESVASEQNALGKEHVQIIRQRIHNDLDVLNSTSALYYASAAVERQEFVDFAAIATKRHRNIQALAWIPNVTFNERKLYEKQAKADGLANFEFKEISAENKLQKAGKRDRYFPVYYAAPLQGNEKVLGFDLASSESRLSALSNAALSGQPVSTAPIELVEESTSTTGVLVFVPVYREMKANVPAAGNEFNGLRGFVQLVLKAEDVLRDSMRQGSNGVLNSYVQDVTDSENHRDIYGDPIPVEKITHSQSFEVAGRIWRVDTAAIEIGNQLLWIPWLIMFSGFAITALMAAGLAYLINRREVVELLVKERTADLKMLSSIAANSNDMFVVTTGEKLDVDKGGLKILYVNDAFTRVTGFSRDEAIGATPRILHGANTDKAQLDLMKDSLRRGEAFQAELLHYRKDKSEFWADINIIPIKSEDGTVVQNAIIQRDITDRIHFQEEREKLVDKLTDSNEELARFAFVCSHDLQEPLRMIRSFSEKLEAHIADDLVGDEKGQKYFRYIAEGAARAQNLIADILVYSSIDSDTQKLQISDGNELLESVKSTVQVVLQECEGAITHDDIPQLQGNKTQLYQLFQNIINNAIKYKKPGVAPKIHVGVNDVGKFWQFSVQDNGIGMEHRYLKKIFDVFQRLHRRSSYAGTGIGLSICKKVVERHGGKIWVESEPEVGTTFYFTIAKISDEETMDEQQRKAG